MGKVSPSERAKSTGSGISVLIWESSWKDIYKNSLIQSKDIKNQSPFNALLTPLLQAKIQEYGHDSAIAKQFLPAKEEWDKQWLASGLEDPIADEKHQVVPGLIHRY